MSQREAPAPFVIRVLTADDDIARAFPLMHHLRERLEADTFVADVRRQQREGGYVLAGVYVDGRADEPVTLAGFRVSCTLARGPHLFVDDLVTSPAEQGNGYGKAMIAWLRGEAVKHGLPHVWLDSRATAKGFYERAGFTFLTSIPCYLPAVDAPAAPR